MDTDGFLCSLFGIALVLGACSNTRTTNRSGMDGGGNTRTGVLHLSATYQPAYCGGADPGLDYPRPYPWQGPMYLRRAQPDSTGKFAINDIHTPVFDSIRTNALGQGYLVLPPGTYLLLDRDRVDDRRYRQLLREHSKPTLYTHPIDTTCMRKWLIGPFGVVTITSGDTLRVDLPFFGKCPWNDTPCVGYFGPYPP
jgi:hypothetical protein